MKPIVLALALLGINLAPLGAATFTMTWPTIAAGASTSSGGGYHLSNTIGQTAVGQPLDSSDFSMTSGFWSLFAVPTSNAPLLTIWLTPTNTLVVSWPSGSTGFSLQANGDLSTQNWAPPPEQIQNDGMNQFIVVTQPAGTRFFRLSKP